MTISSSVSRADYVGDGVTTAFPVPFPFFDTSELRVVSRVIATGIETVQALGVGYSVTGGGGGTGTVTAMVAPTASVQWSILRATRRTQDVDYQANDPFPAETHERALDRVVAVVQEIERDQLRSIRVAETDSTASLTLPAQAARANRTLGFDASGNPVPVVPGSLGVVITPYAETILSSPSAAAARAALDAPAVGLVATQWVASALLAANPTFVEFALPTTFNSYEIQFENVTPSLNAFMACQFSRDGGANWVSNPSDYASGWYGSLSPGFGTTATGSQGLLSFTVSSTATAPLRGVMRFALPAATGAARWTCETGGLDALSGFQAATTYHGTVISGARPNRLRIYWSTGVWTNLGAVALHGVRAG